MTRRRIYLAGPISKGDLAANINQATAAFKRLAEAGFAPFCPQWSALSNTVYAPALYGGTAFAFATPGGCGLSHETWLAVDLAWAAVSDAVLRLPGESVGADRETAEAKRLGIPVSDSIEAVIAADWAVPG